MFVTMSRIPVREDHWTDVEDRFKNRLGLVDKAPGFLRNIVLRPVDGTTDCYIVMTLWKDRGAFEAWTKSDAFIEAHYRGPQDAQKLKDAFKGAGKLESFEAITDSAA